MLSTEGDPKMKSVGRNLGICSMVARQVATSTRRTTCNNSNMQYNRHNTIEPTETIYFKEATISLKK